MAFTTTDGHTSGASAMRVEQGRMLYGLREIAATLRCSEKSVLRYVARYGLPAGKIGGRWCADEARLREWLERGGGHIRCDPFGEGSYSVQPPRRSNDFLPPLDTSPRFRHPDFPN